MYRLKSKIYAGMILAFALTPNAFAQPAEFLAPTEVAVIESPAQKTIEEALPDTESEMITTIALAALYVMLLLSTAVLLVGGWRRLLQSKTHHAKSLMLYGLIGMVVSIVTIVFLR